MVVRINPSSFLGPTRPLVSFSDFSLQLFKPSIPASFCSRDHTGSQVRASALAPSPGKSFLKIMVLVATVPADGAQMAPSLSYSIAPSNSTFESWEQPFQVSESGTVVSGGSGYLGQSCPNLNHISTKKLDVMCIFSTSLLEESVTDNFTFDCHKYFFLGYLHHFSWMTQCIRRFQFIAVVWIWATPIPPKSDVFQNLYSFSLLIH